MGKPKKTLHKDQQIHKKSKKKVQISKMGSSDDEQVEDLMAWGRKKQNYYREDEQQYSQLSEQEQQAKKIYDNQYDNYLNDEELYEVPDNKAAKQSATQDFDVDLEQDEQEKLPAEYVNKQLEWVIELFKDVQFYHHNDLLNIYKKLLKSYLATIISIKQLEIPYIQYHPIVPLAVQIKTKILKLMKRLTVKDDQEKSQGESNFDERLENESMEQDVEGEDSYLDGEDQSQGDQEPDHCTNALKVQNQEHRKGLEFYNQIKKAQQQQKKQKKLERKIEHQANKKPTFKEVKQNQGRFASQLILKNKGLIKKRKKIEGNSRVKLRKKFEKKKAIHRAKTGHFIRQNPGRGYQGEANIKTGKLTGVRLK